MKKLLTIAFTITLFSTNQFAFAQNPNITPNTPSAGGVNTVLLSGITNKGSTDLTTTLSKLFAKTLQYMYFNKNPYMQQFNVTLGQIGNNLGEATNYAAYKTQSQGQTTVTNNLQGYSPSGSTDANNLSAAINNAISLKPSDDTIKGETSSSGGLFFSSKKITPPPTDDNVLNSASLIGPDNYCPQGACSNSVPFYNAIAFINYVKKLAPPPAVIRIAANQDFSVPIMNMDKPTANSVTLTSVKSKVARDILNNLKTSADYREYKDSYRSYIALRTTYLNNLYHIFYQRKALCKTTNSDGKCATYMFGGKSIMQLKDEMVNQHLSSQYITSLQTATPAELARQQIMLLAQISSQLNDQYKQNQRLLLTKSLDGLSSLTLTAQSLKGKAQAVGKTTVTAYCNAINATTKNEKDKKIADCIKKRAGSSVADIANSLQKK